jgi:hypothetical protein
VQLPVGTKLYARPVLALSKAQIDEAMRLAVLYGEAMSELDHAMNAEGWDRIGVARAALRARLESL